MNIAEFIHELANRTGIDIENQEVKDLVMQLSNYEIAVPDAIAKGAQSKLMSVEEAKNNADLHAHFKKHYIGTALGTVDRKIQDIMYQIEAPESVKQMVLSQGNTYDKIGMLAEIMKNKQPQLNEQTDSEKSSLLSKINELNEMLNMERENKEWYVQSINEDWRNRLMEREIDALLGSYDYALDVDKGVVVQTAKTLMNNKLKERGAKYVYDENGVRLVNAEMPDLPFTMDNKPVNFKDFTDQILAESKLLKVNKSSDYEYQNKPSDATFEQSFRPYTAPAAKSQTLQALMDFKTGSSM